MNVFAKLRELKNLINKEIGVVEDMQLFSMVQTLANNWHYRKKKTMQLSKEEAMLYEILISHSYNPSTVYKWLLLVKTPQELRDKLRQGLVNQREAREMKKDYRDLSQSLISSSSTMSKT